MLSTMRSSPVAILARANMLSVADNRYILEQDASGPTLIYDCRLHAVFSAGPDIGHREGEEGPGAESNARRMPRAKPGALAPGGLGSSKSCSILVFPVPTSQT
jgi:hypothetical protein